MYHMYTHIYDYVFILFNLIIAFPAIEENCRVIHHLWEKNESSKLREQEWAQGHGEREILTRKMLNFYVEVEFEMKRMGSTFKDLESI